MINKTKVNLIIVKDDVDKETGIYHSGDFRIFLTDAEADLYKTVCKFFLNEFDSLDSIDDSWVSSQSSQICNTTIYTGIDGFDYGYPPYLKKIAIRHCCDLLTNIESKLPTLGYDHAPLRVTAEALAQVPLHWLANTIERDFTYLFSEEKYLFNLIWQVANNTDALNRQHSYEYYGWKTEEERREFMDSIYPKELEDTNKNKWKTLIYDLSDRLLASYDSDWQMFFHKADVYEDYIKGTELLPIKDLAVMKYNFAPPYYIKGTELLPIKDTSSITSEPMTQTILEPQQTDLEDVSFIPSFSIKKLGKVLLGDHQNLPDSPGIYFAIDSANRVWYVGISTSSLRQRHAKHEKLEDFKTNKIQHIAYFVWTDEQDLHEWELGYIQKFDPPLNMNYTKKDLPQIDLGYSREHFISRYREIKQQKELLDQELEELKSNLVTLLEANGGKLADRSLGFSGYIQSRRIWQYSEEVEARKEAIKQLQKQEEETGIATVKSITTYPVFRFR